jgi:putative glutamine amidotransferase
MPKSARSKGSRPVIITNLDHVDDKSNMLQVRLDYTSSLEKAGAIPLCLPPQAVSGDTFGVLEHCDGVLLIGGRDYDPRLYGAELHAENVLISKIRQDFDLALAKYALEKGLPVFGICGGHQLINIVLGGSLYTSVETQIPNALVHRARSAPPSKVFHPVNIATDCRLFRGLESPLKVNSFHHQGVKELGKGLRVTARAPDGAIEGIELTGRPVFGVQWHPEMEPGDAVQQRLFKNFVDICREGK